MLKEVMFRDIDGIRNEMTAMADDIFDHPEIGLEEFHAQKVLTDWLEKEGFAVERGVVGVETAFKAVYRHGEGGPNIGLLCEYDALPGIGHACGHHMQGPSILAAAKALKDAEIRKPYTITVYGTPAEESVSGKIRMIQNGCTFEELDVALMMHGGPATQVDVKSLANSKYCSPMISRTGNTIAAKSPAFRFSENAPDTTPTTPGPEEHPRSPASARSANNAVPPFGQDAAAILKVPGQNTPTENPQSPHPSSASTGFGDNAASR